jgi:hypothetical protein
MPEERADLWELRFGARVLTGGGVEFRVWAPLLQTLSLRILQREPFMLEMRPDAAALTASSSAANEERKRASYFFLHISDHLRCFSVARTEMRQLTARRGFRRLRECHHPG